MPWSLYSTRWGLDALELLLNYVEGLTHWEPFYAQICWGLDALDWYLMHLHCRDNLRSWSCIVELKLHYRVKLLSWFMKLMFSSWFMKLMLLSWLWWCYDATWLLLWYVDDVYVVKCKWWIICLLLLNVKSHPFCLKMLLFVWVTCR
jgi:hypothetical protein